MSWYPLDSIQSKKKEILMKVCYDNGKDRSEFMKKAFQVEGMMCQHCEQRVNKALQGMELSLIHIYGAYTGNP